MQPGGMQQQNMLEVVKAILAPAEAGLFASTVGENPPIRVVTFDLSTAVIAGQEKELSFGFQSFVVLDATDNNVSVNIKLGSNDSYNDAFAIKKNYQINLPLPVQKAYFTWSAQSSKSITILFMTRGLLTTNNIVASSTGQSTPYVGDTVTTQSGAQVTTSAAVLFAADSSRKLMTIQNQSGQSIWIGGSTVTVGGGAVPGIEIKPDGYFEWASSAACYAITSGSSTAATAISLTKWS